MDKYGLGDAFFKAVCILGGSIFVLNFTAGFWFAVWCAIPVVIALKVGKSFFDHIQATDEVWSWFRKW